MSRALPPGMSAPPPREAPPAKASRSREAERLEEGEPFLGARVPKRVHRAVKERCFKEDIPIRTYLLALLAKDGIR